MNIVISGTSRGIGFETAVALAKDKRNTIIALSRNIEGLERLKETAREKEMSINTYCFDLRNFENSSFTSIFAKYEVIDILINNAGILINKPFQNITIEEWKDIFESNFFGSIKLIKSLMPYLIKSTHAHIVNIGSMGGYQGSGKFPGLSAYSASKAALANLTECLAEEFRSLKISVNCLALGSVNTEMLNKAFPNYVAPLDAKAIAAFIADFSLNFHKFFNGKILPVSTAVP